MKIALSLLAALLATSMARAQGGAQGAADAAPLVEAPPLEPAEPAEPASTYKQYSQIYCGKDAVDAECQAKFTKGYGEFLSRVADVCKGGSGWLKKYDERCEVVVKRADAASPALLSEAQWAEIGKGGGAKNGRFNTLLAQEARELDTYQMGYDAALRINASLKNEVFTKKDFESALKRRTRRMLPDHGTKVDTNLHVINVIYVYLGAEAKDFLIGADGKSGKLGFLEAVKHIKDSEKLKDEEKYFSAEARKALAEQKAMAAQGGKSRKQAQKMSEELRKGLKGQIDGLAKGGAAQGDVPAAAGVATPFWSGAPRSAEQVAIDASKLSRTQIPKDIKPSNTEPPAVEGDKPEKKGFEGCHSLLGWKCAVRAIQMGFNRITHHGGGDDEDKVKGKSVGQKIGQIAGKIGHEAREAVMIGPKTKAESDKDKAAKAAKKKPARAGEEPPSDASVMIGASPSAPIEAAKPDEAAAFEGIKRRAAEATSLAAAAETKAKSAAARALEAAAGKDPAAVAAAAEAKTAADEALNHAAAAKAKAGEAVAAKIVTEGMAAGDLANTSAVRADVAARRALDFADVAKAAAETAAKKKAPKLAPSHSSQPQVTQYEWGKEIKNQSGEVIETDWLADKGSYLKVLNKDDHFLKTLPNGNYQLTDGTRYEWGKGDGKKHCGAVKGRDVLVIRRTTGLSVVTLDAALCPGQVAPLSAEEATRREIRGKLGK